MNKIFRYSAYICVSLMVAVFGTRVVGQAQSIPHSIAQLHLVDCAPPCWIGITPGVTSLDDAKTKLVTTYGGQSDLKIRDSSDSLGYVSPTTVENIIGGNNFYLVVHLNILQLVDGKNEAIQSIALFESRSDNYNYAPTVADILGTFGAPQWVVIEELMSNRYEITLKYRGLDAVFYTYTGQVQLTENPILYLGNAATQTPSVEYRTWKGFSTFTLGK